MTDTASGEHADPDRALYDMVLDRVGYRDGAETTADGSADNDLAHERAHAVMRFIDLPAGSTLPGEFLPRPGDIDRQGQVTPGEPE